MSEKQKKQTLSLTIITIVCVILTSLLLTYSLECSNCGKKITGKYYVSLSGNPFCKDCGKEYYRGFPGDIENVSERVNNTARNGLVIAELLGFIVAVFFINKNKMSGIIKKDCASSVGRRIPVTDDEYILDEKENVHFIEKDFFINSKKEEDAQTDMIINTSGKRDEHKNGGLKTTFKTKAEHDNKGEVSEEHKNDWFKAAGDL